MMYKTEKLKKMTASQLYQTLHDVIQEFYKEYQYTGISKESYDVLILSILDESLKSFAFQNAIKEVDSSYFVTYIRKKMNQYVKKLVFEEEAAVSIISNYITMNLKSTTKGIEAEKELERLSVFLNRISFEITPEFVMQLLNKSESFMSLVAIFVQGNEKQAQVDETSTLDENIHIFVETYTMLEERKNQKECMDSNLLELFKKVQNGDIDARNELTVQNLGLVGKIANRNSYSNKGLSYDELFQEGTFGLMKAIQKFNPSLGLSFSTYACIWIHQAIVRSISDQGRLIRIPVKTCEKISKMNKVQRRLEMEQNHNPDIEEISKVSGFSKRKVSHLQSISYDIASIDALDERQAHSTIGAKCFTGPMIDEEVTTDHVFKQFREFLYQCNLKPDELEVLLQLYGFYGPAKTQIEVAREMGISNESVRQKEAKAIRELRRHKLVKEYAILMDNPAKAKERIDLHREQYRKYGTRATYTLKLLDEEKMQKASEKKKTKRRSFKG